MGIIDRIKDAVSPDDPAETTTSAHPEASGPAAASGDTAVPAPPQTDSGGQASEAGSGYSEAQTSGGGADAVPDTPDGVPENYT